jgi:hypothetical protein
MRGRALGWAIIHRSDPHMEWMTSVSKPYVKPKPPTKDQLREMLALAVRNTQPAATIPVKDAKPASG